LKIEKRTGKQDFYSGTGKVKFCEGIERGAGDITDNQTGRKSGIFIPEEERGK